MNLFSPFVAIKNLFTRASGTASRSKGEWSGGISRLIKVAKNYNEELDDQKVEAIQSFHHHEKPQESKFRWQHVFNAYHDMRWRDERLGKSLRFWGGLLSLAFAWDVISNVILVPGSVFMLGLPSGWEVKIFSWLHGSASALSNSGALAAGAAADLARSKGFIERYWPMLLGGGFMVLLALSLLSTFVPSSTGKTKAKDGRKPFWWMSAKLPQAGMWVVGHAAVIANRILRLATGSSSVTAWLREKRGFDDIKAEAFWRVVYPGTPTVSSIERDAKERWSPEDYPSLYLKDIPVEMRRSMVAYGTPFIAKDDGQDSDPGILFSGAVSPREGAEATRVGLATGLTYLVAGLLAYHPNIYFNWLRWFSDSAVGSQAAKIQSGMGLSGADALALASNQVGGALTTFWAGHGWLTAVLLAVFMGLAAARRVIRNAIENVPAAAANQYKTDDGPLYFVDTQEQKKVFKSSKNDVLEDERDLANVVSRIQKFDKSPTWTIGYSTGELISKGRIGAPMRLTPICMSLLDTQQNVVVFGGTGSGKTLYVIKPAMRAFLAIREDFGIKAKKASAKPMNLERFEAPEYYPEQLSMLLMDGKADLYSTMQVEASKAGQKHDFKVIGLQPNESVIDLLDGLPPQLVATFLKSMASQMGASSTDSFWPDQAALFIERAARVAEAFDISDGGLEWRAKTGVRPYSLRFIYELLSDMSGARLTHCTKAIIHCFETDVTRLTERNIDSDILLSAIRELNNKWINDPAEQTRSNIQSNIDNMLKPITSEGSIANTFASGNGPRGQFMKVKDFWGSIVATNIKSSDGAGGAMVLTFIKTLFMYEALKRQGEFNRRKGNIEREFMRQPWFMQALGQVLPDLCRNEAKKVREKLAGNKLLPSERASVERESRVFGALPSLFPAFIPVFMETHRVAVAKGQEMAARKLLSMPVNFDNSTEYVFMLIGSLKQLHAQAKASYLDGDHNEAALLTDAQLELFNRYESMLMTSKLGSAMHDARHIADSKIEALRLRKWDDAFAGDDLAGADFLREYPSGVVARELESLRSFYETPQARLEDAMRALRALSARAEDNQCGFSPADMAIARLGAEEEEAFSQFEIERARSSGEPSIADLGKFSFEDVMECRGGEEAFTSHLDGNAEMLRLYYEWRDISGLKRAGVQPRLLRDRIIFMCDEHQEIITIDRSASAQYTDSGFWNVSRSAGVTGILCTQTITTYYKTVNNDNAVNAMLEQMRTKICAPSEDLVLIRMFKELAGTVRREEPRTGSKYEELNRDLTFVSRMVSRAQAGIPEFSILGVAPTRMATNQAERINGSWALDDIFADSRSNLRFGASAIEREDRYHFAGQVHTNYAGGGRNSNEDTIKAQRQQASDAARATYNEYINREVKDEDAFDAALFKSKSQGRFTVSVMRGNRAIFDYIDINP